MTIPDSLRAEWGEHCDETLITFTTKKFYEIEISNKVVSNATFAEGEVISVSADFTNNTGVADAPVSLLIALYNGDDMYAVDYTPDTLGIGGTETLSASITVPEGFNAAGASVKVFTWNSVQGMKPIIMD